MTNKCQRIETKDACKIVPSTDVQLCVHETCIVVVAVVAFRAEATTCISSMYSECSEYHLTTLKHNIILLSCTTIYRTET